MATAERQPRPALSRVLALLRRPGRYGFLAVVDLLTRAGVAVQFRHDPTLAFHPGELRAVDPIELPPREPGGPPGEAVAVTACFLGLTGSFGPVPLYLSELTASDDDAAGFRRALLAPFHHRLYDLYYRAARRCDLPRAFTAGAADVWSQRLLAWLGLGTLPLQALRPLDLLQLAPLLAGRPRTARGLTLALRHVVAPWLPAGATLTVEQFAGGWARLAEGTRMKLGQADTTLLGHTTVIGSRCRDPAGRIRLHIGPLPAASLAEFSPGGPALARIRELTALFLRAPLAVELELLLEGAASPPLGALRLGRDFRLVAPGAQRRRARFDLFDGAPVELGTT